MHTDTDTYQCLDADSMSFRIREPWGCLSIDLTSCAPPSIDGWPILAAIDYIRTVASGGPTPSIPNASCMDGWPILAAIDHIRTVASGGPTPSIPNASCEASAPVTLASADGVDDLVNARLALAQFDGMAVKCSNDKTIVKVACIIEALDILTKWAVDPASVKEGVVRQYGC